MITKIYNNLIWFEYKDDEVAWDGKKYLSICSCGEFDSLEDLDLFWEDYGNEMRRQNIVITKDMAMDAGDLSLEGQTWQW
jgi:hypothetical protein